MNRALSRWPIALGVLLVCTACTGKKKSWDKQKVDPAVVAVDAENLLVRTDALGGTGGARATFVLVTARNTSPDDLQIDVGGELVDSGGAVVAPLRADSLRVPAGGERMFALVDKANQPRPKATSAKVRVVSARKLTYKAEVVVTEGNVFLDNNRVVATGYAENVVPDRAARVLVVAAFFDAKGKPMTRPYTLIKLLGGQKRAMRFVGPTGSAKGMLFIGQAVFD